MKIAFVFDDSLDKPDGIQQYMLSLRDWFIEQGHDVHFLVGQTKRTDITNVHSLSRNIKVNFNGNHLSIPLWGSRRRIKRLLRQERYDVLHVQTPYHPYMAGWIMKLAPPSTVVFGTFHIAPYSRFVTMAAYIQAWLSRSSQRRFNKVVSVSPAAAEMARRVYGLTTEVVPNVFDYHRFHDGRPRVEYDDDITTILFLGRLVERKGCLTLLQSIAALQSDASLTLPRFRVVICGGGSLEKTLRDYTRKHGLNDIVQFVGRIDEADKADYYASSDISVFPAYGGESFGIVLIEAMASGRAAVLGGDNPGYRSVLGSNPEQLFAVQNPDVLKDKLAVLLMDAFTRQRLARDGAKAAKQYDVNLVGARLIELYRSCQKQP